MGITVSRVCMSLEYYVATDTHVIRLTNSYSEHPGETPLYIEKSGVSRGVHAFLILAEKHRMWVLIRTASSGIYNKPAAEIVSNSSAHVFRESSSFYRYGNLNIKVENFTLWKMTFMTKLQNK